MGSYSTWVQYAQSMAEGGFLAALSSVCLLHYLVHLYYVSQERRVHAKAQRAITGLKNELRSSQSECSVALAESALLHQILAGQTLEQMLQSIMQEFVPDTHRGWTAYFDLNPEPHLILSRGSWTPPTHPIDLEDELLAPALAGEIVTFQDPRIAKSRFLLNFDAQDRSVSDCLYVIGVRSGKETFGLLVTTHLSPSDAPVEQQYQLARRMRTGLAGHIAALKSRARQERELRNNSDRLAVRALFDREFDNPLKMIRQFLRTMQLLSEADRGVLFFSAPIGDWEPTSYLTSGDVPEPCHKLIWHDCEERLTQLDCGSQSQRLYDEQTLSRVELDQAFKAAVVTPVVIKGKSIGTLCLTRLASLPFTPDHQRLLEWSVELLAEKMAIAIQQAQFKRMAQLDAVTQIANRHTFERELDRELQIAYSTSGEISLIMLDLDRFKQINDNHGHQAGDEALRVVAQLLKDSLSHLRADDRAFCARFGGEEFAIILPGVGPLGATRIAELIRGHIANLRINWQDKVISLTVSGGIATYPDDGATAEEMIATADKALYEAKNSGRNRIAFSSHDAGSTEVSQPVACAVPDLVV